MPDVWIAGVGSLSDYEVDRGLRRLMRSGKPHAPSLPEFLRLCREVANDDLDTPALPALPAPDNFKGDDWTARANLLMLKHVLTQASKGVHYSCVWTRGGHWKGKPYRDEKGVDHPPMPPTQETKDLTQPLVDFKNAWALDMRENAAAGSILPTKEQNAQFAECMRRADELVAQVRARYAKQVPAEYAEGILA